MTYRARCHDVGPELGVAAPGGDGVLPGALEVDGPRVPAVVRPLRPRPRGRHQPVPERQAGVLDAESSGVALGRSNRAWRWRWRLFDQKVRSVSTPTPLMHAHALPARGGERTGFQTPPRAAANGRGPKQRHGRWHPPARCPCSRRRAAETRCETSRRRRTGSGRRWARTRSRLQMQRGRMPRITRR